MDTANGHLSFIGGNLPQQSESVVLDEEFDYVVMAQGLAAKQPRMVDFENIHAQQVVEFLRENLRYQTLMVLTLVFRKPLPLPFDVCKPDASAEIGLVVRASSKPGMDGGELETWTVCASAAFARQFALPKTKNDGLKALREAFFRTFGLGEYQQHMVSSHGTPFGLLWPHGQPVRKLAGGKTAIFCPEAQVGVCADYCGGAPCVESAVVSALTLADALASHRHGGPMADAVLTHLDVPWEPIPIPMPWTIAHFPGMPTPPTSSLVTLEQPERCCPTHDWLGSHPGLVFGRTAASKPWERGEVRRSEPKGMGKGRGKGKRDNKGKKESFMKQTPYARDV